MNHRIIVSTLLAALPACDGATTPTDADEPGVLELALQVDDPTGGYWHLSGGEFSIMDGSGDKSVATLDTSGAERVLRQQLAPGSYTVALTGDWHLERLVYGVPNEVDAELLDADPIPVDIAPGQAAMVDFRFKLRKGGTLGITMNVDAAPLLTAFVHINSVEETEPWFDRLVGADAVLTWSFDRVVTDRRHTFVGATTAINGVENALTVEPATDLLAAILAWHDTLPSSSGQRPPYYYLVGDAVSGGLSYFSDDWGFDDMDCSVTIAATPSPVLPVDFQGYTMLVPFDAPVGQFELACGDGVRDHQAHGTVAFDVQ